MHTRERKTLRMHILSCIVNISSSDTYLLRTPLPNTHTSVHMLVPLPRQREPCRPLLSKGPEGT